MRGKKQLLLLAAMLPLALIAKATDNNEGRGKPEPAISGIVSETGSKKPVQGVTVSISGKGQQSKDKQELITDAMGNFKVPQMPAGELIIILEKKGYKTFRKEGVMLKEGVPLKLSFDMSNDGPDDESDTFHPLRMMDGE